MARARLISANSLFSPSPDRAPPRRIHPSRRALADAARDFLADCIARNLSPRTSEQYEWSLRNFSASLESGPVLADLSPANVRAWVSSLPSTRSPSSVRSALRALEVFSSWVAREGYISGDPLSTVLLPRVPDPLIVPLADVQVAALMRAGSPLLRACVALLVDTGMRSSELCGLRIEDVRERFLLVLAKGGDERLVPYGETAASELTRYVNRARAPIRHADEALLLLRSGRPLTPHHLGVLMRQTGARAKIKGVRVSPHTLRHTFAIEFLRNGGGELALQKALGHRSLDMVRIYARLTEVDLANVHASASPLDRWQRQTGQSRTTPTRSSRRSSGDRRV
jgi:site-specific recombinase XerD